MPFFPLRALLAVACVAVTTSSTSAQFGFFGPPPPFFAGVRLQRAYPIAPFGPAAFYGYPPVPPAIALSPFGPGSVAIHTPGFSLQIPSPLAAPLPLVDDPYAYSDGSRYDDVYAYVNPLPTLPTDPYPYAAPPVQSYLPPDVSSGPVTLSRESAIDRLRQTTIRLANALAARSDAEGWLAYLQPNRVAQLLPAIEADDPAAWAELRGLEINYAGVMQNDTLVWLRLSDGFAGTRSALANLLEYEPVTELNSQPPAPAERIDLDGPEELPTPRRERV